MTPSSDSLSCSSCSPLTSVAVEANAARQEASGRSGHTPPSEPRSKIQRFAKARRITSAATTWLCCTSAALQCNGQICVVTSGHTTELVKTTRTATPNSGKVSPKSQRREGAERNMARRTSDCGADSHRLRMSDPVGKHCSIDNMEPRSARRDPAGSGQLPYTRRASESLSEYVESKSGCSRTRMRPRPTSAVNNSNAPCGFESAIWYGSPSRSNNTS
mmetsp:Transcript_53636/g.142607  ORF Transcript_53636/g.142607 Transcript_53636/m.142607 type:complete len:218 (-) Transcript_53636:515-1168(-)